jgi:hypothetical protein
MMKVHNSKINKIHSKYTDYCRLRIQAKETGIPFEDLLKEAEEKADPIKKAKKAKKGKKSK